MIPSYLLKDDKGNVGQTLPLLNGETKLVTVFLQLPDGSPFVIPVVADATAKVQAQINHSPLQYNVVATTMTKITSTELGGVIGLQFQMSAVDTNSMAANSSGNPMTISITDGSGNIIEMNCPNAFAVEADLVP